MLLSAEEQELDTGDDTGDFHSSAGSLAHLPCCLEFKQWQREVSRAIIYCSLLFNHYQFRIRFGKVSLKACILDRMGHSIIKKTNIRIFVGGVAYS